MVAERRPWHRVSRRERCPICDDHDSACLIFENGDVLCAHVTSNEPVDHFLGLCYRHRADDTARPHSWDVRSPAPSTPKAESADAATKHAVYTRQLELCPPSRADRDYLVTKAGHTDAMIDGNYGTLPSQDNQKALIATLSEEFGAEALATVPGIITTNGHLRWNGAGLLIAHRDLQGRIQALQVRVALPDGGKVYRWLSSTKVGGPSSGAPAHVARSPVVHDHRILVCESGKTATYLAHTLGATVVGMAGLSNHGPALQILAALAKHEDAEVAVLLFDAVDPADPDAARKEALTEQQRQALAASVSHLGYHVKIGRWAHVDGKGPDDVLIAGHTFTRERYTRPADESGQGARLFRPATGAEMITVDPRFLIKLMSETAAALTLRVRYNRLQAILKDKVLNDGQKLTAIALSAHLPAPVGHEPPPPQKVCAETIARHLGAIDLPQKNGSKRLTKVNTVTKNLADIVTLGVCSRDEVTELRVITKKDDRGKTVEIIIPSKTFMYRDDGTLPGQRMDKDAAKEVPTRAKGLRDKPPRCPHCFSAKLETHAHICLDCDTVSTNVDAMRAGQAIEQRTDGGFVNNETGECVVPGVAPEPFEPASNCPDSAPDHEMCDPDPGAVNDRADSAPESPGSRNMCTKVPLYRNHVFRDPGEFPSGPTKDTVVEAPLQPCRGGCGTMTPHGWECKPCRGRPVESLHIPDGSAATAPEVAL